MSEPSYSGAAAGPVAFRASPQQERLAAIAGSDPAWPLGTVVRVHLRGRVDTAALAWAAETLARRHEILRTRLETGPGGAGVQVVLPPETGRPRLRRLDLSAVAGEPPPAPEKGGRPFGLTLVRLGSDRHRLDVTLGPGCGDAATARLLVHRLLDLHAGGETGVEPGAGDGGEPLQYADLAEALHDLRQAEEGAPGRAHWRRQNHPGLLPLARLGGAARFPRRGTVPLPAAAMEDLSALCDLLGAPSEEVVTASWGALLALLGEADGSSLAAATDGRPDAELADVLGPLETYLPLAVETEPGDSFRAAAERLLERWDQARTWAETLDWSRLRGGPEDGGPVLFSPLCLRFPEPPEERRVGGLVARVESPRHVGERFHLLCEVHLGGPSPYLELTWDPAVYSATGARALGQRLAAFMAAARHRPERPLAELEVLTPRERAVLLGPAAEQADEPTPVLAAVEESARRDPAAVAVEAVSGEHLTYGALLARSALLASHLVGAGAGPERPVALHLERSPRQVVAVLAALRAGAPFVPVEPDLPAERRAYLLRDSGARVVVADRAAGDAPPAGTSHLVFDEIDWSTAGGDEVLSAPVPVPDPDSLAYVLYTSGSTGRPKGVMVTHRGLANYLAWCRRAYGLGAGARSAVHSPLGFDLTVTSFLAPLTAGGRLVLAGAGDGVEPLAKALETAPAWDLVKLTPSHLEALAARGGRRSGTPRVGTLVVGGEALRGEALAAWAAHDPGARAVNEYGPTETVVGCTTHAVFAADAQAGPVPIGRAIPGARAHLVNRRLRPVPPGVVGELVVGGVGVSRGYRGRPGLTAAAFVPDPWSARSGGRLYRTGDLARQDDAGTLHYVGRIDHQVKLRGVRVEPGEVAAVLAEHPAVAEAAVVPRGRGEELRLVAYVVAAADAEAAPGELRAFAAQRLPETMIPAAFVPLAALPLTANGKLDRAALPAPRRGDLGLAASFAAPRSALEGEVAALWAELLEVDRVGRDDNFFDLGGHSLLLARMRRELRRRFDRDVPMVELFRHPTVRDLAALLSREAGTEASAAAPALQPLDAAEPIAVVGMAGRFPGAASVGELWHNLLQGVEGISFFDDDELRAAGVPEEQLRDPRYVRARGVLEGAESFDAAFFGLSPREAELTDPQHRVFLECAWETLEDAGYDPYRYPGRVGVFAGVSINTYLLGLLATAPETALADGYQALLGNDKDFLPTRVSYKLNLRGPSLSVQTACSTSLVATHLACESLRRGEAEMALVGGTSVRVPQRAGYRHQEGGISSPDGHCRPFDAEAGGTVQGSGVAAVLLKPLSRALADGDRVRAVIRGSAMNNDGSDKVGYTAPSVDGQAAVIASALERAGVDPDSVGYVEAHGTGTALGDPIEVAALARVFGPRRSRPLELGSVKSNVGHLDAAAGVTGLIKAVLAVESGTLPPSLHFQSPNPELGEHPCRVVAERSPWPDSPGPRRAGVSSFGIGGTNAHVVVEQAPPPAASGPSRPTQLLLVSARSEAAAERALQQLGVHLAGGAPPPLADAAYTLATGRARHPHRRALVASDAAEAASRLTGEGAPPLAGRAPEGDPAVVFLFPGQGTQRPGMTRGLYDAEPVYRRHLDTVAELLAPHLERDVRELVLAAPGDAAAAEVLTETRWAQPALFAVELALALTWRDWGVRPSAVAGHSLGEYVAACVAGVLAPADAARLVAVRGRLMQEMSPGAMLGVGMEEAELIPRLPEEVSVAAVNGPRQTTVSGPAGPVEELARQLAEDGVACRPLVTSHAFHSVMMEPAAEAFRREMAGVELAPPELPMLTNLAGEVAGPEVADAEYWVRQLLRPVRFGAIVSRLAEDPSSVFLEVGPGRTLAALVRRNLPQRGSHPVVSSLPRPETPEGDGAALLEALGRLWLAGVEPDWDAFWAGEERRRVALPTYPFERRRYWLEATPGAVRLTGTQRRQELADWFYVPSWRRTPAPRPAADADAGDEAGWLLFADDHGVADELAAALAKRRAAVIRVRPGDAFRRLGPGEWSLDPRSRDDFGQLTAELAGLSAPLRHVVHLWGYGPPGAEAEEDAAGLHYRSLVSLAREVGSRRPDAAPLSFLVAASGVHEVTGDEEPSPGRALHLGPCRTLPVEYPHLACRSVDLPFAAGEEAAARTARRLLAEAAHTPPAGEEGVVAYRGPHRWSEDFSPVRLAATEDEGMGLSDGAVCLITGGLGGLGLEVARLLAREASARLVLLGRSGLPPRESWDELLAAEDTDPELRRRVEAVRQLEAMAGGLHLAAADVADRDAMAAVLADVEERFGPVEAVFHAAGLAGGGLVEVRDPDAMDAVLRPKVEGTRVLADLLADAPPRLFVLFSSLTSVLGGVGQVDYTAANAYLDAFAAARTARGLPCLTIDWVAWRQVGMAARAGGSAGHGVLPEEGLEALRRAVASGEPRLLVSPRELGGVIARARQPVAETPDAAAGTRRRPRHQRPELATPYVTPRDAAEEALAEIWGTLLGLDRVGVDDDFFELGGDSLVGIQVVARAEAAGLRLEVGQIFEHPTVASLAEVAEQHGSAARETVPAPAEAVADGSRPRAVAADFPLAPDSLPAGVLDRLAAEHGPIEDVYPLTPTQAGMLFYHLYAPASDAYFQLLVWSFRGDLDEEAFLGAWQHMVERHAALRTAFVWEGLDEPVQVVYRSLPADFHLEDWRDADPEEQEERMRRFIAEDRRHRVDLARPPVMRWALFRLGDDEYRFVLSWHHLLFDGWSMTTLNREGPEIYHRLVTGEPLDDLPPAPPFRDYVAWMMRQERAGSEAYWRRVLEGVEEPTRLAFDRDPSRMRRDSADVDGVWVDLGDELSAVLTAAGRRLRVTLNTLLQGAWSLLMSRFSGDRAVLFGMTSSGRPAELPGVEKMVGLLITTVPLRVEVPRDEAVVEWLGALQKRQVEARRHERVSVAEIQSWIGMPADRTLFDCLMVFQGTPGDLAETPWGQRGIRVRAVGGIDTTSYPLVVYIQPGPPMRIRLAFDRERFRRADVAAAGAYLRRTLEALTMIGGEDRVADLLALDPVERQRLLVEWNTTPAAEVDLSGDLASMVLRRAADVPDAVAVEHGSRSLTYGGLRRRATAVARRLHDAGVKPGEVVGLLLPRSLEAVVGMVGILAAGAAYLPLDPRHPRRRRDFQVEDAGVRHLVTADWLAETDVGPRPEPAAAWGPADPRLPAYVIYTSGSTGVPKGVVVEHRAAAAFVAATAGEWGLTPRDRVLGFAALTFDASVEEIFPALASGATLVVRQQDMVDSAEGFLESCRRRCLTILDLPTAYWHLLSAEMETRDLSLPATVRQVVIGGEAARPEALRRWRRQAGGVRLFNTYGPTEATVVATRWIDGHRPEDAGAAPGAPSVPIGRAAPGRQAYVLDAALRPVAPGVVGELCLGGAGLARGYLGRPGRTAAAFVPDPWSRGGRLYRSGDLVRWRPEGVLEFVGRADDQVKVRGFRIELGEVEAALLALPRVEAAAVLAQEATGGLGLVAYVVVDGDTAKLSDELAGRLPGYMVPSAFVALERLPLTASGKVDRRALPDPGEAQRPVTREAARSLTEEVLAGIFAEVLGLPEVGVDEDFFALGGHSLLATRVVSRVRDSLGVEISVRGLFEAPTVAGLARRAEASRGDLAGVDTPPLVPQPRPEEGAPLSFAQRRLWFLAQLEPTSAAYNVATAARLAGPLGVGALKRALAEVTRRHEILRTRFPEVDGRPVQRVEPPPPPRLPVIDLAGLEPRRRQRVAGALGRSEAARPFELEAGPPLRSLLLRLGPEEHGVLTTLHHVVTDGWSMGIFRGELARLYDAVTSGRPSPLPELSVQYADYALWQRSWLSGEIMEHQLDHWRRELTGAPRMLELPTDRPRPPVAGGPAASRGRRLDGELAARLRAWGRGRGATPFMVLLAAWGALLGRFGAGDDVPVGTPVAGRTRTELEGLIGFFVNTLVMRLRLGGGPSFAALVDRVREVALAAHAHQDVPFERMVEELAPRRHLAVSPLFQVVFALQNAPGGGTALGGGDLRLEPMERSSRRAKFDLVLTVTETGDGLDAVLEYRRDLFDATTVDRLLAAWERLLAAAVDAPERRLDRLELLSATERHQVVAAWNDTARPYPRDASLAVLFARRAEQRPDATALAWGRGATAAALSYAELAARAGAAAVGLARLGVAPGDAVGLAVERGPEAVVAVLAILAAGGHYVPLDPSYPPGRLELLADDSGCRVVVTHGPAGRRAATLASEGRRLATVGELEAEAGGGPAAPPWPHGGDHLAYVMYTSGSTGRPKGVEVSHRAVARLVLNTSFADFGPQRTWLQLSVLQFDASTLELWGALLHGGRLVLHPPGRPAVDELLALVEEQGVDSMFLTTGLFNQVASAPALASLDGVHQLISGGDVMSPEAVRRVHAELPGLRLVNGYGPTENTTFSSTHDLRPGSPPGATVPIGRPIANSRIHVVDGALRPQPPGATGRLFAGGDGIARGYLARPGLTARRFVPDPFAHRPGARLYDTGDLARWRADGSLDFLGRADLQVKLRGFRIEPGEVEATLTALPEIRQAVVALRQVAGDRRLVAYAVPEGDAAPSPDGLRRALAEELPDYMVPTTVVLLDELPLGDTGKVDRKALPDPEPVERRAEGAAPRTLTEEVLAGIFAELLGVVEVGVDEDFFALGGHSLLATRVVSRLRGALGVELGVRDLFEAPTVEGLARRAEAARTAAAGVEVPPLVAVERPAGGLPLSFAQQRLWFLHRMDPGSTAYNVPTAAWLEGPLDVAALRRALAGVVRRHEALRTVFTEVDGEARQRVLETGGELPLVDLSDLGPDRARLQARHLGAAEAGRAFDLEQGPVLRATLMRLAPREHAVFATLHHAVTDGWSMGIFRAELGTLYRAFGAGRPSPLAPLPVGYPDYAAWQRSWLRGEVLDIELEHWHQILDGAPEVLELPADRPRPQRTGGRAGSRQRSLPADLRRRLTAFGRGRGATLFMTLLAGWAALLERYGAGTDLPVGAPVAGRTRSELEGVVGFFVNTLVLRLDTSGGPDFATLVDRVREVALTAHAHQEVPFERLVQELRPRRAIGHTPLFQVMFALQNAPSTSMPMGEGDLRMRPVSRDNREAKFDLSLTVAEGTDGLEANLEFRRDLFDGATAQRLLAHWHRLLEAAVDDPQRRVADLAILDAAQRQQLLVDWNDTGRDYPGQASLAELFARRAAERPDATALEFGHLAVSYGELARRAAGLAGRLRRAGAGAGSPVALICRRSPDAVVGMLGILAAGGFYVPVDPDYPAERVRLMLADSGCRIAVVQPGTRESTAAVLGDGSGVEYLDAVGEPAAAEDLTELTAGTGGGDHLAYVMYTSGSTGRPKGVEVTHRGIARLVLGAGYADLGQHRSPLLFSVLQFDVSTFEIYGALLHGGRLVIFPTEQPSVAELLAGIERHRADTVWLTAGLFEQVALEDDLSPLRGVAQLLAGGDAVPVEAARRVLRKLPGTRLIDGYGPTENTTFTTAHRLRRDGNLGASVPIGRPIANTRVYVLDGYLRELPVSAPGRLYTSGDGVARGYLGRPARTARSFIPDPFSPTPGGRLYDTGDLARWRPDGRLEFLGRADSQVKLRGFRVEPGEVEVALRGLPEVAQAAVLVREVAQDRRLVAYVVAAEAAVTGDALRRELARELPSHLVPSSFVLLEELPLNPSGKVDRKALPEPGRVEGPAELEQPRNPTEDLLAGIFAELLGLDAVGIRESFFDLGGHSLLATRAVSRIRDVLGVEVTVRDLFEAPAVAMLAHRVDSAREAAAGQERPPLVAVERLPEGLPLSFAQRRLWFLNRMDPASSAYNVPTAAWLEGPLDIAALGRALDEVVRRHEALRTVFVELDGRPRQRVRPPRRQRLPLVDLSSLPPERARRQARDLGEVEASRAFDLQRGPVLRTSVLRLGEREHALFATLHHLVTDGWSMGIFRAEIATLYGAYAAGRRSPLPELPLQYPDYAAWQRSWLAGEVLKEQLDHWRRFLTGAPEALDLPVDRPRPPRAGGPAGFHSATLPAPLRQRLEAWGRSRGATLFITLLAAWAALLQRYGAGDDLPVGTPVAGRTRTELEGLIGFFVNTLVLRLDAGGAPSFSVLVDRVRNVALTAHAHQEVPFERLVEELSPRRELSHTPLFQVLFAVQNAPAGATSTVGGELRLRPVSREIGDAKLDLALTVAESSGTLEASLEFRRDLFDATTAERLLAHWSRLLAAAVAHPERPLADLEILEAGEREQILVEWNDTARPYPRDRSLVEIFADRARERPDAVAVSRDDESLSFGELARRGADLGRRLRSGGVTPGSAVGLAVERGPDAVVAMLGILAAGGHYVPLDPAYPLRRLALLLRDCGCHRVVVNGATRERLAEAAAEAGGEPGRGASETPDLRLVDAVTAEPAQAVALEDLAPSLPAGAASPLAYVMYTSGSTGHPKGVEVTQRGVARLVLGSGFAAFGPGRGLLQASILPFDASTVETWGALLHGGRVVVHPEDRPGIDEVLATVERQGADVVPLTSGLFQALAVARSLAPLATVRQVFTGGDAISLEAVRRLRRRLPGVTLTNVYGPTENTTVTTHHHVIGGEGVAPVPIGRPIGNTEVYVLDRRLRPLPVGAAGLLFTGGDGLARGYLERPDLTAWSFVPNPFAGRPGKRLYRTGDLARWRPDGSLAFLGRADLQVKVRGFRIELGEVEAALAGLEEVRQAAVAVTETAGDRRLVAYAVMEDDAEDDVPELQRKLGRRLPSHMVPATFVFLDELPLTANAKLDRKALPAPDPAELERDTVAPGNALEHRVLGIWREILGDPGLGVRDDFFACGGHSLLAVRLLAVIRDRLGVDLPVASLFRYRTVEALAERLRLPTAGGGGEVLVPLDDEASDKSDAARPIFLAHPVGGHALCYVEFSQLLSKTPCYGLQPPPRQPGAPFPNLEDLAAIYLEALRRVQPAGPYRLGGWSMGGALAFEMARRLEAAEESVEQLVLIDSLPPGAMPSGPLDEAELVKVFAADVAGLRGADLTAPPEVSGDDPLAALHAAAQEQGLLPSDIDLEAARSLFRLFSDLHRALAAYAPPRPGRRRNSAGRLHAPITLVRAENGPTASFGDDLGWSRWTASAVSVHALPGGHYDLLRPPLVERLADIVSAALEKAADRGS